MTSQQQPFRSGQHVRIIACPQNHPDHQGQVGTVSRPNKRTATIRVYVGVGICNATVVEPVTEEPIVVTLMPTQWPMVAHRPGD
jgi:ribosomal protein L21E